LACQLLLFIDSTLLMKTSLLAVLSFLPSLAFAHPGHDGHELVWEYRGGHVHIDWMLWTVIGALLVVAWYRSARKRG
jgi:hypothetical protein